MNASSEPGACPVCATGRPVLLEHFSIPVLDRHWHIAECPQCGCAFTEPRPDDDLLKHFYGSAYDYRWFRDHYGAKLRDARERLREYAPWLGRCVLDFGGGLGYFSVAAARAGLESATFDPYVGDATALPYGGWDSLVALHVLEHSNDPGATLGTMHRLLRDGGTLILAVPNYESAGYRERGAGWVWAQPPIAHLFHFTARGLAVLLARHGFEVEEVAYRERWDANYVSDVLEADRFARLEADWSRMPWNRFVIYRRHIARRNARLRREALARALREPGLDETRRSELQVRATANPGSVK